ncbi:MAG: A-macroglobulin complement component [Deltaproteobacteria bacterium]|jgi:hypothetical protein|nr:A-macroglobulin complement component [Deltaproteobacteria bacterium]
MRMRLACERRFLICLCLLAAMLLFLPGVSLSASSPQSGGNALPGKPETAVPVSPEMLGGAERFLLFLSTDKPLYKTGETLYARAVALSAAGYFPRRDADKPVSLTIVGPRKNKLVTQFALLKDSSAGFAWAVPAGTPGGRYTAEISMPGAPAASRSFEIRAYAPPRLKTQIAFLREGYGPGDTVTAVLSVTRAEGGLPAGARVSAVARVDGKEAARVDNLAVDGQGRCRASFTLPKTLERGEGTLAFIIADGGVRETASKTIPILLRTLDVSFYPEGGEMVAGLPGRIYVQARRPDGKPADVEGEIVRVNAAGAALGGAASASLRTLHEGRGIVELTPAAGERYALRLRRPAGIDRLFPLPAARSSGAALRAEQAAYPFDQDISLAVRATPDSGAARLTLYQRERLLAECALQAGQNAVRLNPGEAEGVLMVTVWARDGKPLAERLIFRRPRYALRIALDVESAGPQALPGGKIRLKVETRDETGRPVEAVVGLSVTDDALLEMVEKRDQAPNLPVMAYLENEVLDLADAAVYLDAEQPEAARNLDLLLGVQGWRRFILVRLDEALRRDPEAARRALALAPPPVPPKALRGEVDILEEGVPRRDLQMRKGERMDERVDVDFMAAPEEPAPLEVVVPADRNGEKIQALPALEPRAPGQRVLAPAADPYVHIREYAHKVRPGRRPNDRVDFAETLYWHAGLRTDPRNGRAEASFELSDSVTTFRVRADGFGNNGALGASGADIISKEPFYVEIKLPPAVVAGDRLTAPLTLVNATAQTLDRSNLIVRGQGLRIENAPASQALPPDSRLRVLAGLVPEQAGGGSVTLNAAAGPYADTLTRPLLVLPRGFPVRQNFSGLLGPEKPAVWSLTLPAEFLPGSLRAEGKIYPTPLANMEEALNALLRQPHGCFEQTSSTNFPLVMAQQYFLSHSGVSPERIREAGSLLDAGYKKLVSFESPAKGYEWFGGDPGHEALTAYGLMQFAEMDRFMPVDKDMLARTRNWLLSRRDGSGGFKRNERALDSFGAAPPDLTNLYILWALLESGEKTAGLRAEIQAAKTLLAQSQDPYLLALGVNILHLASDNAAAGAAAARLRGKQGKDGSVPGGQTSITRSRGEALLIETTSLAILGWLRVGGEHAGAVESAMGWLFERCKAGRFGSTQSTILALKAINAYDAARAKPKDPGMVQLRIDGRDFGSPLAFTPDSQGALLLPDFSAALSPGEHKLELVMQGGGDMPFSVEILCHTPQPANGDACPLRLSTALSARETQEGEPLELTLRLEAGKEDVSMPVAVIGLPAGLEPRHERLKELAAAGRFAAYELRGRELVLYWRGIKGGESLEVSLPLIAEIPGVYTAPASRAYAFYQDEQKFWVAGEAVTVLPR